MSKAHGRCLRLSRLAAACFAVDFYLAAAAVVGGGGEVGRARGVDAGGDGGGVVGDDGDGGGDGDAAAAAAASDRTAPLETVRLRARSPRSSASSPSGAARRLGSPQRALRLA